MNSDKKSISDVTDWTPQSAVSAVSNRQRRSKSWTRSPIRGPPPPSGRESKLKEHYGRHNMLSDGHGDNRSRASSSSIYATTQSQRFQSFLEDKRISNRPFYIVRQSDSDILLFKEDHYDENKREYQGKIVSIGVLPADEMNCLTSEIKLWHSSKRRLTIICICALLTAASILAIDFLFALVWFSNWEYGLHFLGKIFQRESSFALSVHMIAQTIMLFMLALATVIYRLTPEVKLSTVTVGHVIFALLGIICCVVGTVSCIAYHESFTKTSLQFYSIHSWFGLAWYLTLGFSVLSGLACIWYPTEAIRGIHARLSMGTFMFGVATATCGYFMRALIQLGESYYKITLPGALINTQGILFVFFCCLIRLIGSSFIFRRRPKPLWDVIVYRSMEAIEDVYLEIHDMYDSYEMWVKQVNHAKLGAMLLMDSFRRESTQD